MLDLSSLRNALTALRGVLSRAEDAALMSSLDELTRVAIRSGVIQHFEFSYELSWKFIQRWIALNRTPEDATHPVSRKELFRLAAQYGLINDPLPWFEYGEARNLTSHTYDLSKANAVFTKAQHFVGDAEYLLAMLEKSND